ncbi:squalene/phytoene synthase family protein [Parvularcula maris]|uniref:Squalene/phytoene synthase family protein n=1 Tax=Parvularcula maris TaxID=2965077 RepID=A0A9X2RIP0_9PROT|nr:squalene/phytoene synthase family protein [Parvularcula maris]MCQ8183783.1 squalene/phytoene synthase family protein [Parvularcula maris]
MIPDELLPRPFEGDAKEEVRAITKSSGTSFAAGMGILRRDRREAMHAVYAFCRVVDDIADGDADPGEKRAALEVWREEVELLYRGRPVSAVGQALLPTVAAYDLPKEEFLLLIDGMQTDADGPVVAPTRTELARYTRQVAGTVGMLSIRIFGAWKGEVSDRFALCLGDALQLTNIIRDVEEDAGIGRLYLPAELLEAEGVPHRPNAASSSPKLPAIRKTLGAEAEALYDEARLLAREHDRASLRPALMMMGAYEGYLLRMERGGWRLNPGTPLLSSREKLLRGLRYAFFGPGAPQAA